MHVYDNILFNTAMSHQPHSLLNKVPKYKDVFIRRMSIMAILEEGKNRNKNECSSIRTCLNKMWCIHSTNCAGFKVTEIRSMLVDLEGCVLHRKQERQNSDKCK